MQRFCLLLSFLLCALSSPNAGQITCFGDSWAAFACPTLEGVAKLLAKLEAEGEPEPVRLLLGEADGKAEAEGSAEEDGVTKPDREPEAEAEGVWAAEPERLTLGEVEAA